MKFYISGSVTHKEEVRRVMDEVEGAGHTVTLDWTNDFNLEKPYANNPDETRRRAHRDLEAVNECEVFVLVTCQPEGNSGMYVELGAALSRTILTRNPKIFVIGEFRNQRLFYYHPVVKAVESIQDVLAQL